MYDLVDAVLSMKADIYRQQESQDPQTGSIVRKWYYYKTIPCHAKGMISNSKTERSGDFQQFNNKYANDQSVAIRTNERISLREKITNIRTQDDEVIWVELDFPTNTPTVYEVVGTTPMTEPFGGILAFNSMLKRSENQKIDL